MLCYNTHKRYLYILLCLIAGIVNCYASFSCGCKTTRSCYQDMVDDLQERDEESCIAEASVGISTVSMFLKAIKQFCPDMISFSEEGNTYERRPLYEVVLSASEKAGPERNGNDIPTILIEAGQDAGIETLTMSLHIIEQLVACEENNDMLAKAKWVILPCSNPDGTEYTRYNRINWKKNMSPSEDKIAYGVDITRNFDYQWGSCESSDNAFSANYPGPKAGSENETVYVQNIINKYKNNLKLYLSLRRNGHAILYPHSYTDTAIPNTAYITRVAADVAAKVNQRAGGVQLFLNESMYENNGKQICGSSVDYAYNLGVPLAYEYRMFLANDYHIMSMFQQLPRGYEASLRLGYFSGIRTLYNAVIDDKENKQRY